LVAVVLAVAVGLGCDGTAEGVDAGLPDADPEAPDARPVDAGGLVPCDPLTQIGCGSHQKCSIVPSDIYGEPDEIGCVPGGGALTEFEPCTPATHVTPDDCEPGLACVGSVAPRCLPFCADTPFDTCDAGQACALGKDLDGDWVVDVSFCAETCDLFAHDCGDPSFACYPTQDAPICLVEGAGDTPALEGEPCPYANSCAEGLGCFRIGVSPDWYCFAICDPYGTGGPTCGMGQSCNPVQDEVWGICQADY